MTREKNNTIFIEPEFTTLLQKTPIQLVDIGASGGLPKNWESARKHLYTIGFEPDEAAFKDLQNKTSNSALYFNVGLYNQQTTLDFYSTRSQGCSSIFRPNREFLNQFPAAERFDIEKEIKFKTN